jgi:DNA-binding transcriptional regulator YhcF (GntR family)
MAQSKSQSRLPPHRLIERELRVMLQDEKFTPHSSFLSEVELCERFKVNVATARKAVRNLEEEGLLYKIHRKGTFVSPPSRNKLILFVTTERSFSTVGRLTPVASEYPTFQWLELPVEDLRPVVEDIRYVFPRLEGVFFVRDLPRSIDVMRGVQAQDVPTFFYGSDAHTAFLDGTHSLLYRESEMTTMAMDHLGDCGCRNIGILTTDDRKVFSDRHKAYRKWMTDHGLEINPGNVISLPESVLFDPTACFEEVHRRIQASDFNVDGFFCANELCSATFIQAVTSLGIKIPGQMKVAGIEDDDRLTARIYPQPTSVRIPFDDDIRESFRILTEIAAQKGEVLRKFSDHLLIRRQST